jgi:hypothetical protein
VALNAVLSSVGAESNSNVLSSPGSISNGSGSSSKGGNTGLPSMPSLPDLGSSNMTQEEAKNKAKLANNLAENLDVGAFENAVGNDDIEEVKKMIIDALTSMDSSGGISVVVN